MKPAPFDYHAPRTLDEAAGLLATLENAKVLAGGQSLVPMMNFRYVIVDHLVDLAQVEGLRGITVADGAMRIGAMTRQRDLEFSPDVEKHCPLMRAALGHIGHRQTRNRGTIGGSLVHADPAAELPAVCAAHDAVIEIASARGTRTVPFAEFVAGFMATAVEPDEIVTAIKLAALARRSRLRLPGVRAPARRFRHRGRRSAGRRRRGCGRAARRRRAVRRCDHAGSTERSRGAAGRQEARCRRDPQRLPPPRASIEPISDIHAGADYRRHLAEVLTHRALTEAAQRAGAAA